MNLHINEALSVPHSDTNSPCLLVHCLLQDRAQILWQGIVTSPYLSSLQSHLKGLQSSWVSFPASGPNTCCSLHMFHPWTQLSPRPVRPTPGLAWGSPFSPPSSHRLFGPLISESLGEALSSHLAPKGASINHRWWRSQTLWSKAKNMDVSHMTSTSLAWAQSAWILKTFQERMRWVHK